MKNVLRLFIVLCIALAGTAAFAQDIQTKGSIGGSSITDSNGGALPNAKVTLRVHRVRLPPKPTIRVVINLRP